MQLLRTYVCQGYGGTVASYYAQVQLDDDSILEVSSREPLDETGWLALAVDVAAQMARVEEPTLLVEAEDGTIV